MCGRSKISRGSSASSPGSSSHPIPSSPHRRRSVAISIGTPALFDAVEWNAMFTAELNFNRRAKRWAARHGKPLVGNGDVHRLYQLGTTYSRVDAEPDPDAICAAIAAGRVQVESRPLSWPHAVQIIASLFLADVVVGRSVQTAAAGPLAPPAVVTQDRGQRRDRRDPEKRGSQSFACIVDSRTDRLTCATYTLRDLSSEPARQRFRFVRLLGRLVAEAFFSRRSST